VAVGVLARLVQMLGLPRWVYAVPALARGDRNIMTGTPYAIRLVSGLRAPKQRVLGQDLAGTVEAVGDGVTGIMVGDEVVGVGVGAFAGTRPRGPPNSPPS
jgi:NADPH:quinone reductase-like Zn-dependent oxidoreductase